MSKCEEKIIDWLKCSGLGCDLICAPRRKEIIVLRCCFYQCGHILTVYNGDWSALLWLNGPLQRGPRSGQSKRPRVALPENLCPTERSPKSICTQNKQTFGSQRAKKTPLSVEMRSTAPREQESAEEIPKVSSFDSATRTQTHLAPMLGWKIYFNVRGQLGLRAGEKFWHLFKTNRAFCSALSLATKRGEIESRMGTQERQKRNF